MDNEHWRSDLDDRWIRLAVQYGAHATVAEKLFETIVRAYSEPGRHYHTLTHVAVLLDFVQGHDAALEESTALQFAAWFHDVIYDTTRSDNEDRSADFAANILHALMVPEHVAKRTAFLIAQTKQHEPTPDDPDAQFFIDADLAILGAAPEIYRNYLAAIRREYAWADDAHFMTGRRRVLERFLARERIYHTPEMYQRLEQQARTNLRQELEEMGEEG